MRFVLLMKIDGLGMLRGILEANWVVVGVDVSVSEGESKWERDRFFPPTSPFAPSATPSASLVCGLARIQSAWSRESRELVPEA